MGLDFLERRIGTDFDDVQQAIFRALDENEEHPLQFDSSAGDNTMVAAMKDVVERMARVTARTIRWLGDTEELNSRRAARKRSTSFRKPSLKMSISLSSKSLQASLAGQVKKGARFSAESLARSSTLRRGSGGSFKRSSRDSAEVVNEESAIFVCCSRDDAVRHARVLRSELSVRLGRGCGERRRLKPTIWGMRPCSMECTNRRSGMRACDSRRWWSHIRGIREQKRSLRRHAHQKATHQPGLPF
eukprot:218729-Prymnesium_polylepis.1